MGNGNRTYTGTRSDVENWLLEDDYFKGQLDLIKSSASAAATDIQRSYSQDISEAFTEYRRQQIGVLSNPYLETGYASGVSSGIEQTAQKTFESGVSQQLQDMYGLQQDVDNGALGVKKEVTGIAKNLVSFQEQLFDYAGTLVKNEESFSLDTYGEKPISEFTMSNAMEKGLIEMSEDNQYQWSEKGKAWVNELLGKDMGKGFRDYLYSVNKGDLADNYAEYETYLRDMVGRTDKKYTEERESKKTEERETTGINKIDTATSIKSKRKTKIGETFVDLFTAGTANQYQVTIGNETYDADKLDMDVLLNIFKGDNKVIKELNDAVKNNSLKKNDVIKLKDEYYAYVDENTWYRISRG